MQRESKVQTCSETCKPGRAGSHHLRKKSQIRRGFRKWGRGDFQEVLYMLRLNLGSVVCSSNYCGLLKGLRFK